MTFASYLALISVLDMAAILSARLYIEKKKTSIMWLSLISFALSGYVYVKLMQYAPTAIINIMYIAFSTIIVTSVCYFAFKEKVTFGQAVGIATVVLGISLLEI